MDSRMEESGIPNHANDLPFPFFSQCLSHAMGTANARSHADIAIDHIQRRICAQSIASNVTGGEDFQLPQDMEYSPMRASWTQIGWSRRKLFFEERFGGLKFLPHHPFLTQKGVQLTTNGE